jgi:hypothetical protein
MLSKKDTVIGRSSILSFILRRRFHLVPFPVSGFLKPTSAPAARDAGFFHPLGRYLVGIGAVVGCVGRGGREDGKLEFGSFKAPLGSALSLLLLVEEGAAGLDSGGAGEEEGFRG